MSGHTLFSVMYFSASIAALQPLPAATIEVEGKKISSNTSKIKVLPPDKTNQSGGSRSRRSNRGSDASSIDISNEDLFMRAVVNKTTIYHFRIDKSTYKNTYHNPFQVCDTNTAFFCNLYY